MELKIGIDPKTGLDLYRELDYFIGAVKEKRITVYYNEWLVAPNGTRLQQESKRYFVVDTLAITSIRNVLVTPEVLDEFGTIVTEAVYKNITDIISPARLLYTEWKEKPITSQMIGAKLGDDIIVGVINSVLLELPLDIQNNYYK